MQLCFLSHPDVVFSEINHVKSFDVGYLFLVGSSIFL